MALLLWLYYYGSTYYGSTTFGGTAMATTHYGYYLLWPLLAIQAAFLGEVVAAVAARGMRTTTVLLSDHGHLERGGEPNPSLNPDHNSYPP